MEIKYYLDENMFSSSEKFKENIRRVNNKEISIDDIEFIINRRLKIFYMDLKSHFKYEDVDFKSIYKKEVVINYIKNNYRSFSDMYLHYLQVLIDNGIVTNCSSGYMFDTTLVDDVGYKRKSNDLERVKKLLFHKTLTI